MCRYRVLRRTLSGHAATIRRMFDQAGPQDPTRPLPIFTDRVGDRRLSDMEGTVNQETVALVTLLRSPDAKWSEIAYEVAAAGSASAVLAERGGSSDGLFSDPRASQAWADASRDVAKWSCESFRVVTVLDPDYPARLLEIHEMPPLLFVRGRVACRRAGRVGGGLAAVDRPRGDLRSGAVAGFGRARRGRDLRSRHRD